MRDHYLAIPRCGTGPGVLVLHSWWGLNPFFRRLCDRLAKEGFVALAPDLFDGETAESVEAAKVLRARAMASRKEPAYRFLIRKIETLVGHDAVGGDFIGVLGFSMGGHWAFWLAQRPELPISTTVTFYACRNGDYSQSRSAFLCHFAEDDEWVSPAGKRKLQRTFERDDVKAKCYEYPGTGHWFFESNRPAAYHRSAARTAWVRTLDVLRKDVR